MMFNAALETVHKRLIDGAFTCVVRLDEREYVSRERGVTPLMPLLESGESWRGAVAADKTVGAGAAHLYVLLGVRALWADVVSQAALVVLQTNGIDVFFETCVPYILNRRKDGTCPMELAVTDATTSEEAYRRMVETLKRLQE